MVTTGEVRKGVFKALRDLYVANKPQYQDGDKVIQTYSIVGAYPESNPSFPMLVINPARVSPILITMDGSGNIYGIEVQLDFYTKQKDEIKAIDAGRDSILKIMINNQSLLKNHDNLLLDEDFWDDSNVDTFQEKNQLLTTATVILSMKLG